MRGVRALAAALGVAAALGLCVWGGALTYDAIDSLTDGARIGETRTPIPGTTDVELDEGKYVVFYEVDASSVAGEDPIPVPGLIATIRRGGDGPPLAARRLRLGLQGRERRPRRAGGGHRPDPERRALPDHRLRPTGRR